MPIYDYSCRSCGRDFTELVRTGTVVRCPGCDATTVERRLSIPAPPVTGRTDVPMPAACESPPPGGCCGGGACGSYH